MDSEALFVRLRQYKIIEASCSCSHSIYSISVFIAVVCSADVNRCQQDHLSFSGG